MNKPEQNTSNRAQRMKRAGLVLLGTAATATLLGGGYAHENAHSNEIRAEITMLRHEIAEETGGMFVADIHVGRQRVPDNDPRLVRIAELYDMAAPHDTRRTWYVNAALGTVLVGTSAFALVVSGGQNPGEVRPQARTAEP